MVCLPLRLYQQRLSLGWQTLTVSRLGKDKSMEILQDMSMQGRPEAEDGTRIVRKHSLTLRKQTSSHSMHKVTLEKFEGSVILKSIIVITKSKLDKLLTRLIASLTVTA